VPGTDAGDLPEVAERVVRAVGPLLRHGAGTVDGGRGGEGGEVLRVPGRLVLAGDPPQHLLLPGLQPATDVQHRDLLVGARGEGQRDHGRGGPGFDDEVRSTGGHG
jgi:hypothetical protein